MSERKTVCVDFDGVIADYHGWKGEKHLDPPKKGAKEFLKALYATHEVVILTTRNPVGVLSWFYAQGLQQYITEVTDQKVQAVAYVDDRGVCFEDDYDATLAKVLDFKTYWEKEDES